MGNTYLQGLQMTGCKWNIWLKKWRLAAAITALMELILPYLLAIATTV